MPDVTITKNTLANICEDVNRQFVKVEKGIGERG
jgi:hypothetical protein